MALTRSDAGTAVRDNVTMYQSRVLGNGNSGQPLPRSVMQSTTPKIPYSAKTGSGAMPSVDPTNIFGLATSKVRPPAPRPKSKITAQPVTTPRKTSPKPASGKSPSYSTAKGAVGARGAYGLEAGAGSRLQALQGAYRQQFGSDLPILSGGRTFEEQTHLYNLYKAGKGNLAAKPGTSVHESGRAVDFGGAAHGYSKQQTWLVQNAPKFGWHWAGKNFSQVEPWHFEALY